MLKLIITSNNSLDTDNAFDTVCAVRFALLRTNRAKPFGHSIAGQAYVSLMPQSDTKEIIMKIRKQHYVWRFYLQPWCFANEQISCSRKGKVFTSNLMGIANERDFYKLHEISDEEESFIIELTIKDENPILKEINMNFINAYRLPYKLIHTLQAKNIDNQEMFSEIITNAEEKLYGAIECSGIEYIKSLRNKNISFYDTEEGNIKFNYFICEQYMRTKKRQEFTNKITKPNRVINLDNIWPILRHVFATNVAFELSSQRDDFKMVLLENNTSNNFITGDQPVINTYATKEMQGKPVTEFEIFYPITPKLGIFITKNKYKNNPIMVTENQIEELNNLIYVNSLEQLYALSEIELDKYWK
jgi:hypothetical protein